MRYSYFILRQGFCKKRFIDSITNNMAETESTPNKNVRHTNWDAQEKSKQKNEENLKLIIAHKSQKVLKQILDTGKHLTPSSTPSGNDTVGSSTVNYGDLKNIVSELCDDDTEAVACIAQLNRVLCSTDSTAALADKESDVVRFVDCLANDDDSTMQCVAAGVLINIASDTSEHTRVIIRCKLVPALVPLLISANATTTRFALLVLGNIAAECEDFRNNILNENTLSPLLKLLRDSTEVYLIKSAVLCLSNLSQSIPGDRSEIYSILLTLTKRHDDIEVLSEVCWALYHFLKGETNDVFIDQEQCQRLVDLLEHESEEVVRPVLRAVGQIVSGDDAQVDVMLRCSLLPRLLNLLCGSYSLQEEICTAVARLTTSNSIQVHAFFPPLVDILRTGTFKTKVKALCVIHNITARRDIKQTKAIVQLGGIESLCDMLKVPDIDMIFYVLYTITNILEVCTKEAHGDANTIFGEEIEELQSLEKIEMLQNHENEEISEITNYIIDTFFLNLKRKLDN